MENEFIISDGLEFFFPDKSTTALWNEYALWMGMRLGEHEITSRQRVIDLIAMKPFVYAFPDPLPALHLGMEPPYKVVRNGEFFLADNCIQLERIFEVDPLYLMAPDFSWLVASCGRYVAPPYLDPVCILARGQIAANQTAFHMSTSSIVKKDIDNSSVVQDVLEKFYNNRSVSDVWRKCPTQMLWDNPVGQDIKHRIISQEDVVKLLTLVPDVFVFPEPLPALYMGIAPVCKRIQCDELKKNCEMWLEAPGIRGYCLLEPEPLYIVDPDYAWMICLTTENAPDGGTWCILLEKG